jgi:hypothetical protein
MVRGGIENGWRSIASSGSIGKLRFGEEGARGFVSRGGVESSIVLVLVVVLVLEKGRQGVAGQTSFTFFAQIRAVHTGDG